MEKEIEKKVERRFLLKIVELQYIIKQKDNGIAGEKDKYN